MKKTFYSELAYIFGLVILALGTAFMERADFGMSMVVAPAYILFLKLSQFFPAFTFGMAEYCLQFVLVAVLSVVLRRFKRGYLFSVVTAVVYGLLLDSSMVLIGLVPGSGLALRSICFLLGMVLCSVGVALLFRTYFAPEAYELVVKEAARVTGRPISRVKTVYDLTSLCISVVLSFCFFGFGHFEGVKWGTLLTALVNGWLIGRISALLDKKYTFADGLPLRNYLEN